MGNPMKYHDDSIIDPSSLVFRPVQLSVKWFTVNNNKKNSVIASLPHSFIFFLHWNNRLHWNNIVTYHVWGTQYNSRSSYTKRTKNQSSRTNYIPLVLWLYPLLTANLLSVLRRSLLTTMELIAFAFIELSYYEAKTDKNINWQNNKRKSIFTVNERARFIA